MTGRIYHWKHGWIPLDSYALAEQERRGGALKLQKTPGPIAPVRGYDDLSPELQGKINGKLESMTGLSEPELATRVQANLRQHFANGNPNDINWYANEGNDIARRATAVGTTRERLIGMVAVTSAHKRWQENKDFAQNVAKKLQADQPFDVSQEMIDDYNGYVSKRKGGLKPHPDLTPGTYRPSELPTDFVVSKTPGMPHHLNTDYVLQAAKIYRGEATVDQAVNGPKQRSFVNNLMSPAHPGSVTNDTWHYRAAMAGIPLTRTIGPKGNQRTYNYTLEQWGNRDLARRDGRAEMFGYDSNQAPSSAHNIKAILKATPAPQEFFQSGPASKAEGYDGSYGAYPWFTKQTQIAAKQLGVSPNALQAVAWYSVGGGQ